MSGGLAPSKSTIYVSNLPFSLTNNDLHKIFEKYGKVVKVTIMKDKVTRQSKGVAFILFLERNSAYEAVRALNNTQMFGRTIKCHIAKDNGRTTEFIRRKEYKDKSKCYECGEDGHLSYQCSKNLLGEREPPKKKEKKRKKYHDGESSEDEGETSNDNVQKEGEVDSLAAAINFQHQKMAQEYGGYSYQFTDEEKSQVKKKKYKKATYFSDEEELDDG